MKILVGINQAEAFRRGIDAPRSTSLLEIDPADLSQEDRNLIADRLNGNRLTQLLAYQHNLKIERSSRWIIVLCATLEEVLKACRENQVEAEAQLEKHVELAALKV